MSEPLSELAQALKQILAEGGLRITIERESDARMRDASSPPPLDPLPAESTEELLRRTHEITRSLPSPTVKPGKRKKKRRGFKGVYTPEEALDIVERLGEAPTLGDLKKLLGCTHSAISQWVKQGNLKASSHFTSGIVDSRDLYRFLCGKEMPEKN